MVLALNMDEVSANGGTIDVQGMSEAWASQWLKNSAADGASTAHPGLAVSTAKNKVYPSVYDFCAPAPSTAASTLWSTNRKITRICRSARHFAATKLIEDDEDIRRRWNETSWS